MTQYPQFIVRVDDSIASASAAAVGRDDASALQPVSTGVPWPQDWEGELPDKVRCLATNCEYPCQTEVLTSRSSGRPDWVLVTACLPVKDGRDATYQLCPSSCSEDSASDANLGQPESRLRVAGGLQSSVNGGPPSGSLFHWQSAGDASRTLVAELLVVLANGERLSPHQITCQSLAKGAVYDKWMIDGALAHAEKLRFQWILTHYKATGFLKLEASIHNPRRAEHPGNFWDLGDPASQLISDIELRFSGWSASDDSLWVRDTLSRSWYKPVGDAWQLTQPNSGGENWQSRAHVDAVGDVLQGSRGFLVSPKQLPDDALQTATKEYRATPQVRVAGSADAGSSQDVFEATMCHFWEKFPNAVHVDRDAIVFALGTSQPLELQGGEKTSRTMWLRLYRSPIEQPKGDLSWVHRPAVCSPVADLFGSENPLEWSRGVDRLPECLEGDGADGQSVSFSVNEFLANALKGPENLFAKRETIDEYGWRNFGDLWADHEELYSNDPRPVISHYNNQYDCLYGLLRQYLRTGKNEWWDLAAPLAEHLIDIDIYDTDQDRAAYSGGLFWHTTHYRDAFTSSHRTYSRKMTGEKHSVNGGGPGNEHNYATGLLLYYRLTGSERAKRAVQMLADWVIAIDDGRRSVLAPLCAGFTGAASSTSTTDYQGPGRGVGNSINTLVDAWLVARDQRYLEKCVQLIRRVIHPADALEDLQLGELELRWSYPVALQAMVRFMDVVGDADRATCDYLQASLVRYGRWMQKNERLALDSPEELEFPTETWAAQDIRKGATMMLIASLEKKENRKAMYTSGRHFTRRAYMRLVQFESCRKTRPMAILLQQLPILADAERRFIEVSQEPEGRNESSVSWDRKQVFVSQRQQVKERLKSPGGFIKTVAFAIRPSPWKWMLSETVLGAWCRRLKP